MVKGGGSGYLRAVFMDSWYSIIIYRTTYFPASTGSYVTAFIVGMRLPGERETWVTILSWSPGESTLKGQHVNSLRLDGSFMSPYRRHDMETRSALLVLGEGNFDGFYAAEQTAELPVIWDAIAPLWRDFNAV